MKVFWSWQSDTPGKIGRHFVRDALQAAIDVLKASPEIDEPTRENLHLDHDREGVPGIPELARTILDKIDIAEVVVADVTLVGVVPDHGPPGELGDDKKLINSNVAIELGYALRALTSSKVLMVFNEHYGTHEDLPFDLRHRGGALKFKLAPDADRRNTDAESKRLIAQFVEALTLCLATTAKRESPFSETSTTHNMATYFKREETLAQIGEPDVDEVDYCYETVKLAYLRLIPTERLPAPLPLSRLLEAAESAPLLSRRKGGVFTDHNDYGAIAYEPSLSAPPRGRCRLNASTQLFQNGELWSITAELIVRERGNRPAWVRLPFAPAVPFEQVYYDKLRSLIHFASDHLDLPPPWQVECGLVGTKGLHIAVPPEEIRGPIRKTEVVTRRVLKSTDERAIDQLLLAFFKELHDATGYARPESLGSFPPSRPHTPQAS